MTINEFLQIYRKTDENGYNVVRPRVKCADGYTVSVQAGVGLFPIYSIPREDADFYEAVELGFPSEADDLIMKYADNTKKPKNTIYAFVSAGIVDELLKKHGGIVGADMSNTHGAWDGDLVKVVLGNA